mgnify:CR=1 FL=1
MLRSWTGPGRVATGPRGALCWWENRLRGARTGAGQDKGARGRKLHEIGMHGDPATGEVDLDGFKVVYVAPMKALVQEMVQPSP